MSLAGSAKQVSASRYRLFVPNRGIVGEALERLAVADLVAVVLGVRPVERDGLEIALITVRSDIDASARQRIVQALDGLPHECVVSDRPARGVVRGLIGFKDERMWHIGTQSDVAWIAENTLSGLAITAAIPPVFDAYATVVIPDEDAERQTADLTLLRLLATQSAGQPWWLGYLDTGSDDLVFDHAPTVTLYAGWNYVLVEAEPEQAGSWRQDDPWPTQLPDLIYPADRSWLVSNLWDDDWRCIGGPAELIRAVLAEPNLDSRSVSIDEDATPPGHVAY